MTTAETIREIKQELHANMNGVASAYMRERGLGYHVNFGIELPRLREIASQFQPDRGVAQALWQENVRESKILATLLMPTESFTPDICDTWVRQIPNAEVAQMAVMNLFARLPYARAKAFEWMASSEPTLRLCGFLLIARLHIQGMELSPSEMNEFTGQADASLPTADTHLRKAVQNALIHITGDLPH
ncbi:MAG: DNA alkylation repair protein [Prevotellaceae bacterium]|nr:DNA alkylation repair protein [Prevotellaceae bacterium]